MKKLILVVFSLLLITCGCDSMMNTPTKRVEEFLNKYQRLDSDVLTQLDEVIKNATYTFNDTQSVNNSTDRSYSYDFTEGIPASAAAPTSVAKPAEVAAPTNSAEPATAATTAADISSNVESPENNIDIDVTTFNILRQKKQKYYISY